jgi:hypothetical protein
MGLLGPLQGCFAEQHHCFCPVRYPLGPDPQPSGQVIPPPCRNLGYSLLLRALRIDRTSKCVVWIADHDSTVTMSDAGTSSVHAPAGFPVQTMLYTRTICDLPTDFSFTRYTDQTLLIITQIGTAGEMGYHVSLDKAWIVVLVS